MARLEVIPGEWFLQSPISTGFLPSGHRVVKKYGMHDGRLVIEEANVIQGHKGYVGPITADVLRSIRTGSNRNLIVALFHSDGRDGGKWFSEGNFTRLRENGPTPETLDAVAELYRLAYVLGEHPTKMVEGMFQLPRSTAGRWVSLARQKGLLSDAPGPGKAGA